MRAPGDGESTGSFATARPARSTTSIVAGSVEASWNATRGCAPAGFGEKPRSASPLATPPPTEVVAEGSCVHWG